MSNKIKIKKVKGVMTVLKVMPYKDCNIYLRRIYADYFEYLLVYEGQIYSQYVIIKPAPGKTKLTDEEIQGIANMLWAGAEATIDTKLGIELSPEEKERAQKVIDSQTIN